MYAFKKSARVISRRKWHSSMSSRSTVGLSRDLHTVKPLPFDTEVGLGDFLSPDALKVVAQEYQEGLLQRLNEEVLGSELEPLSVAQTVIETANKPQHILAFNYASQALNNSFFFDNLLPPGLSPSIDEGNTKSHEHTMSSQLNLLVKESFGSLEGLKSTLSAAAMGMMSSGWVWLVCDQSAQHLGYVATYGPGTMLVRSREQRHPDFISAQLHGPNKANLSRILGEPFDTKSSPKGAAPGMSSMSRGPQIRSFHSTALAQSQIPMLQYQRSSRVSQSPLQWGPLEPLLTAGSPKGRVQPFSSKPPTEDHGENVEEGESIWESTEKKTTASPLLSQSFPNTVALKSLMNDRAFLPFDKGRLRGVGDDIMPLMCISVHEHMWMAGGYGIWGKEEYLKRFWTAVNWAKVSDILNIWTPSTARHL